MTREEMGVLLEQNQRLIFKLALSISHNLEAARELVQDTCLRVLEKASKFVSDSFNYWIKRVMLNLYLNQQRDNKLHSTVVTDYDVEDEAVSDMLCETNDLLEEANFEERDLLSNVFGVLKERDRRVLLMVAHRYTTADIAKAFNVPQNTALSYVHRARVRAKKAYCMFAA